MRVSLTVTDDAVIKAGFFVALLCFGVAIIAFAARDHERAQASLAWPAVDGVVIAAAGPPVGDPRYAYNWRGRNYQGTRRRFITAPARLAVADVLDRAAGNARAHAPGDVLQIYVSPDQPQLSVVTPGGSRPVFLMIVGVGALLSFFGVGGLLRAAATVFGEG